MKVFFLFILFYIGNRISINLSEIHLSLGILCAPDIFNAV